MFDVDALRLDRWLVYRSTGPFQRFPNGTRYQRVLARCCRESCRKPIVVLVASFQDRDTMVRNSSCLACNGSSVAEKFEDMTPHCRRDPGAAEAESGALTISVA